MKPTTTNDKNFGLIALIFAGLGWGTAGPLIQSLGKSGFGVFQILGLRLLVSGLVLCPIVLSSAQSRLLFLKNARVSIWISFGMIFYYLTAIVTFRLISLAEGVVLIGCSPLIAVVYRTLKDRRVYWIEWLGPPLALASLALFFHLKASLKPLVANGSQTSILSEAMGYFAGISCAAIAVFNAQFMQNMIRNSVQSNGKLQSAIDSSATHSIRPDVTVIGVWTAVLGVPIACVLSFIFESTRDLSSLMHDNRAAILGVGILATAVPGFSFSFASQRLSPLLTSTSSVQLQVWTILIGVVFLQETLSSGQILALVGILLGLGLTLWAGHVVQSGQQDSKSNQLKHGPE